MSRKVKYKLKFNDSHMSELDISTNGGVSLAPIDLPFPGMLAPDPISVVEEVPIADTVIQTHTSESDNVEARLRVELSTKLQNLITYVAEELYILLETARDDGDRKRELEVASAIDGVYSFLNGVNCEELENIDQSLLSVLQIANEFDIELNKDLEYESIYEYDEMGGRSLVSLNDGDSFNNLTSKLRLSTKDKKFTLKEAVLYNYVQLRNALIRDFKSAIRNAEETGDMGLLEKELVLLLDNKVAKELNLGKIKDDLYDILKTKDYNETALLTALSEVTSILLDI